MPSGRCCGITPLHRRLNEPDVPERVSAVGGLAILFRFGGRLAMRHAEGGANFKFGVDGLDGAKSLALRNVHHMGGAHALDEIRARRRVNAPSITQKREDPRLIEDAPMLDAVAQRARDDFGVFSEAASQIAIGPASG